MRRDKKDLVISFALFAAALILLVSMISYTPYDIRFETSHPNLHIRNYVGIVGAYAAWLIFKIIGYAAFSIPFLFIVWGIGMLAERLDQKPLFRFLGITILFCSGSAFFSLTGAGDPVLVMERGGFLGLLLSSIILRYFGGIGAYIVTLSLSILALLVATEFLIIPLFSFLFMRTWGLLGELKKKRAEGQLFKEARRARARPRIRPAVRIERDNGQGAGGMERDAEREKKQEKPIVPKPVIVKSKPVPVQVLKPKPAARKKPINIEPRVVGDYKLPGLELLDSPPPESERMIGEDLEANARILEDTLHDFGIEVKVVNITKGPVITRYEAQPAPGVKVHRITALSDDIALVMKASAIRIVAPIPGKSAVGIEVPNQSSSLVYLKELLESAEYQKKAAGSKLAIALGKSISGNSVVADLGNMPHLLIAGTTGSGKTVCVNSLIMSMIYNATPDELKFIMVDPKKVELAVYNGLPHLLCPVVTDSKKASGALLWVVNEMEERYKLLAKATARNIDIFNEKSADKIPYIVVIIDELADLMMVAQQEVENAITRLAQLSRAVGIHIVLATQRPSVDVVTGVIKANFPARISFKVASKVDSRTVLDMNGADKLLGKGDMLFLQPGREKPIRAQGTLLTDPEIERVVNALKEQREPIYDDEILEQQKKSVSGRAGFSKDEFFDEAVKMVIETGQASVSMLQRRLRLGYTRAARLIDAMEEEGIVGPFRGSKPREILIKDYKAEEGE
ncbi:MAG: DNA translocase FtsK [Candidatus Omnitrophica bacterium]|nr:DNA translocase FtsK [Candidatus Omnitrophota bacterium]